MDIGFYRFFTAILLLLPVIQASAQSPCSPARLYRTAADYLNNCYEELDHFEWHSEWGNGEFIFEAGRHIAVIRATEVFGVMSDSVLIRPTADGRSLAYLIVNGPLSCYIDQQTDIYYFRNNPINPYGVHPKEGPPVDNLAYVSSHDTGIIYSIHDIDDFVRRYPRFRKKINFIYKCKPLDMQFVSLWKTALQLGGKQMPLRGVKQRKWRSDMDQSEFKLYEGF